MPRCGCPRRMPITGSTQPARPPRRRACASPSRWHATRWRRIRPAATCAPSAPAMPCPAARWRWTPWPHPGHVSYRFHSQGQSLLVWGDVLHFHAVQFAHPEAAFEADSDRKAAIASRRGLLQQATANGWWVAGAHLRSRPGPCAWRARPMRGAGGVFAVEMTCVEPSPCSATAQRAGIPQPSVGSALQKAGDATPAPTSRRSRRGLRPRRYGLRRRTPAR